MFKNRCGGAGGTNGAPSAANDNGGCRLSSIRVLMRDTMNGGRRVDGEDMFTRAGKIGVLSIQNVSRESRDGGR